MDTWYIYLLRLKNGHLYTGITKNVERRIKEHEQGRPKGAKYLQGKGPLTLVFSQKIGDYAAALKLEYQVKQLSKTQKEKIILKNDILSAL